MKITHLYYIVYIAILMTSGVLVGANFSKDNILETIIASIILIVIIFKMRNIAYRWM